MNKAIIAIIIKHPNTFWIFSSSTSNIFSTGENNNIAVNNKISNLKTKDNSLLQKQLYSFIAAYVNHQSIRSDIAQELKKSKLFDKSLNGLLKAIFKPALLNKSYNEHSRTPSKRDI